MEEGKSEEILFETQYHAKCSRTPRQVLLERANEPGGHRLSRLARIGLDLLKEKWSGSKFPVQLNKEVSLFTSSNGEHIAVASGNQITLLQREDNYMSPCGIFIDKDPYSTFSYGAWSEPQGLLGVIDQTNRILFLKSNSQEIASATASQLKLSSTIVGLFALDDFNANNSCLCQFCLATSQGTLHLIELTQHLTISCQPFLGRLLAPNVLCLDYYPRFSLLVSLVAGSSIGSYSLSLWHVTKDFALEFVSNISQVEGSFSIPANYSDPSIFPYVVFSPKGSYIATVDLKGHMNVFSLKSDPYSLSLVSYGERSGSHCSILDDVNNISWWSDHIAIIGKKGNCVTMFDVRDGRRVLKDDLQFISPVLGSIAGLEGLAFVLEKSAGPDNFSWSLISFSERSIPEMYKILISNQRFQDAVDFADSHGLEKDDIFKSQWLLSDQGTRDINSCLRKIKDRIFVLSECINQGKTEDSVMALISYGLFLTDQYKFMNSEDEQDSATWEFREMRLKLLQSRDMLETFLGLKMGRFSVQDFKKFRSRPLKMSAISLAESGKIGALNLLFKRHPYSLAKHTLEILSAIPETILVGSYGQLLPGTYPPSILLRDEDWVECERMTSFLKNLSKKSDDFIYMETEAILKHMNPGLGWPQADEIAEWYKNRARNIDEFSGQIENSLSLIDLGFFKGVIDLGEFREVVLYLHRLIYSTKEETAFYMSLVMWENLPDYEKFKLMLKGIKAGAVVERLKDIALPFMRNLPDTQNSSSFLVTWLKEMASQNCMDICLRVIEEGCKDLQEGGFFRDEIQVTEVAIDCIYHCSVTDQWSTLSSILSNVPCKSQTLNQAECAFTDMDWQRSAAISECEGHVEVPAVNSIDTLRTRVKKAEGHIEVGRLLAHYQVPKPISFILNAQSEEKNIKQLLRLIMSKFGRRQPVRSDNDWASMWRDMQCFQERAFHFLELEYMLVEFCRGLLKAGKFSLARNYLKGTASTPLASEKAETLVIQAAKEYFFSASSLSSNEIGKARECLSLIPSSESVKAEVGVIDALTVKLPSLGVNLLPMQYKQVRNPMEIINMVIKSQTGTYLNLDEVIETARLLGLTSEDDTSSIREAVAREAAGHGDLQMAFEQCYLLTKKNHGPIWDLCAAIARGPDLDNMDINSRRQLLGFSLSHCDDESIGELLHAWKEIDLQIHCEKLMVLTGSTPPNISLHGQLSNFSARFIPWLYELIEEEKPSQTSTINDNSMSVKMQSVLCILSWMADNNMPPDDDLISILAKSAMENSTGDQGDALGCSFLLNLKDDLRGVEIIEELIANRKGYKELNSIMNLGMMYSSIQSAAVVCLDPEERRLLLLKKLKEKHASLSSGEMGSVEKTQSSFWKAWKLKLEEQKQLADRGRQIEQLIPGVDSSRFLSGDINYIEESILLFVDSVRLKKTHILKSAVELADKYSVQRSKVLLRFLGNALVSEHWSNDEILAEVLDYREVVDASAKEVISVISSFVYPRLNGTNKERLSYVYNLLSARCHRLRQSGDQTQGMNEEFLKLLEQECRRVSFIEDLDFKNIASLSSLNVDQFSAEVCRNISDSSVTALAEMVKNLQEVTSSSQGQHLMTWQSVYKFHVLNHLEVLESKSQRGVDQSQIEDSYDLCRIYIKELTGKDILEIIGSYRMLYLCLSEEFSSKSQLLALLNFWVKLVRDIMEFTSIESLDEGLLTCLQALTFLVETDEVPIDMGWRIVSIYGKVGLSSGWVEEVSNLYRAATFAGCSFKMLSKIFSHQEDLSLLYTSTIDSILSNFDQDAGDGRKLVNLLTSLSETQSVDEILNGVRQKVWEKLVSFSDDQQMPSKVRVFSLQMMEGISGNDTSNVKPWKLWNPSDFSETCDHADSFSSTLVALKSTQLFSSVSPSTEIIAEDMKTINSAVSCFSRLSEMATSEAHLKTLEAILEEWEGFFSKPPARGSNFESENWDEGWELALEEVADSAPSSSSSSLSSLHSCWMLIMRKYVELSNFRGVIELLDGSLSKSHGVLLAEDEAASLLLLIDERKSFMGIKIALLLPYQALWFRSLSLLEDKLKLGDAYPKKGLIDEELLSLSLSSGILPSIASDSSYQRVFSNYCCSVGSLSRICQEAMVRDARENRARERKPTFSFFSNVLFPLFVCEITKSGHLLLAGFMVAQWMHTHSVVSLVNTVEVNLRKFLESQSQRTEPDLRDLGSCKSLLFTVSNLGAKLGDSIQSALSALSSDANRS